MTGRPKGKMPSNAAKRKLVAPEVAEAAVFLARQNANSWVSMTEMRPLITGK
jgi:hypothetical protein